MLSSPNIEYNTMKRFITALILCALFTACKKLEVQDFYLDNYCKKCEKKLKTDVLNIEGIYHMDYSSKASRLRVKYDPNEFKNGVLYNFLQEEHYLNPHDSAHANEAIILPICCQK